MIRRSAFLTGVVALGATLVLAACGGDDGGSSYQEPSGEPQETLTLESGNTYFDPEDIELPAGVNEIEIVNDAGLHTLVVDGVDGFKLEVSGGGESDSGKLELEPGEYDFYCDITGHRAAGMEGTLVVE